MKVGLVLLAVFAVSAPCGFARELAAGSVEFLPVRIDPETVIMVMAEEVAAADFARLMPEGAGRQSAAVPVHSVTREEAMEYARRLTDLNRRLGLLRAGESLRLPTLREWLALAGAPAGELAGVANLSGGVRELCSDTRTETFPSRDNPEVTVAHTFVAVIGAHDQLEAEAVADAMSRPAWIRSGTRSEVVGFRLIVD